MKLDRALSLLSGKDLDVTLGHWNHDRHSWPIGENDRRQLLHGCLLDRRLVAERLASLPSRLRDLLVFVIRSGGWGSPFDLKAMDSADLPVEDNELVPVGTALVERGFFVFGRNRAGASRSVFVVPEELGSLLEGIFDHARKPVDAALSLKACLRFLDRSQVGRRLADIDLADLSELRISEMVKRLSQLDSYRDRVARITDPELARCLELIHDHGGIIDGDTRRRLGIEASPETLEAWGEELERLFLGTFERAELTNHGMSCRVGWLVVFRELVTARFEEWVVDEDEAAGDLQRGPDAQGDIRAVVGELEKTPFRVKKTGEYYKSAVKKLQKTALSPGSRPRGGESDLLFYLDFLSRSELVSSGTDSRLKPSRRWREWSGRESLARTQDLLDFAIRERGDDLSPMHHAALRRGVMRRLELHGFGSWMPVAAAVLSARNAYLRDAVRPEHAQRYQDRHKHAPFPALATPDAMQRSLSRWVVDGLARVGLVELAFSRKESRPWAFRLTRLGAAALGLKVHMHNSNSTVKRSATHR